MSDATMYQIHAKSSVKACWKYVFGLMSGKWLACFSTDKLTVLGQVFAGACVTIDDRVGG